MVLLVCQHAVHCSCHLRPLDALLTLGSMLCLLLCSTQNVAPSTPGALALSSVTVGAQWFKFKSITVSAVAGIPLETYTGGHFQQRQCCARCPWGFLEAAATATADVESLFRRMGCAVCCVLTLATSSDLHCLQ